MVPERKNKRRISLADIDRSLEHFATKDGGDETFELMLAFWRYLCCEEQAQAEWTRKQVENILNSVPGMGEATVFELIWKLFRLIGSDQKEVELLVGKSPRSAGYRAGHAARVHGDIYI